MEICQRKACFCFSVTKLLISGVYVKRRADADAVFQSFINNSSYKFILDHPHFRNELFINILTYSGEITNKMQPCNRIYYSTVHWRRNMFRAAHHSSSRALAVFAASGLHTHMVTGCSQVWVPWGTQTWLWLLTTCICKPDAANTVRAPDDERCAARNMLSLQWTVE
jgi:hypothetical protein